jgi:hypothetical protein
LPLELQNAGQPLPLDIHESASAAGQWTFVEERFFIDPVIDPAIVRDIRVFDKCYVPLITKRLYKTPAGTMVMKQYHVVGRYIENPKEGYEDKAVYLASVPPSFKFNKNKIHALRTLWAPWPTPESPGGASIEWKVGMPPAEVKVGRWLVEQLAAVNKFFDIGVEIDKDGNQIGTTAHTVEKMRQIMETEENRDARIQREAMTEARYRMKNDWRHFKEAADAERWGPEPREPKGFLDLGRRDPSEPPTKE